MKVKIVSSHPNCISIKSLKRSVRSYKYRIKYSTKFIRLGLCQTRYYKEIKRVRNDTNVFDLNEI